MNRREWQVAVVWLNKVLEVYPDRASAYARRGLCHLMTNQMQKADQDFRKAIAEDESLAMAHRGLGVLAGRSGKSDEAVNHLARAIELNPEDPDALGMYPIALLRAGRIPEAEAAYETARSRFPKNRILVQQWLVGLRNMGRADQGLIAARSCAPRSWGGCRRAPPRRTLPRGPWPSAGSHGVPPPFGGGGSEITIGHSLAEERHPG